MNYSKDFDALKSLFASTENKREYDTIELHDLDFKSASFNILPGVED